jgi:hypothetical protein
MSPSFLAKTGFSVGEGVISGVSVCTSFVGIGGAGLIALDFATLSHSTTIVQVLEKEKGGEYIPSKR